MMGDGARTPTLFDVARYFLRLGATGFGGPAALTDRMRVDLIGRGWITRDEFEMGVAIAASCPGPLAYQLAVYCGYARHGVPGALVVGLVFAAAPFAIVVAAAAAYAEWSSSGVARGLFFGAAPAVTVLVARACWKLARTTLHRAALAWAIAAAAMAVTLATGREPIWLFAAAAIVGVAGLRPPSRIVRNDVAPAAASAPALVLGPAVPLASAAIAVPASLFTFFFKVGCLVFGSGLAIVPFLRASVVGEFHWITEQQFLDSVTIGLVSPGPVVITATFVGFLVDGMAGAVAATAGMFLPAILFTIVVAPWFSRHRGNPVLAGGVRGITSAVIGALAGTVPLIARTAIPDAAAAVLLAACAALAWRRVPDPLLIGIAAAAGLAS